MNHADKLISLGADCVGGVLIFKNKELGRFRNGVFDINPEGMKLIDMDITDVEVKEVKKPKKPKVEKPAEPVQDEPDFDDAIDAMLD